MNAVQIDELKQFFVITLDVALKPVLTDIKELKQNVARLQTEVKTLRYEMEEGFAEVGEAIEHLYQHEDYQADLLKELGKKWNRPTPA